MLATSEPLVQTAANIRAPDSRRSNIILTILCLAVFMSGLDLFIVNVALNHIGQDIGQSSLSNLSWILNGYAIFYAALLVPAGRLVDRYGRKAGFLTGMVVFTLASLGCALSVNLWLLIIFRCIEATGAAILTPSSLGLLLTAMPPERVGGSVRLWASSSSFAGAVGPVIGGLLVGVSWRWIFVINLPIGIVAFLAAVFYLPNPKHDLSTRMPDLFGGLILIISIGALALGLVKAPDWGWGSLSTLSCWFIAVVTFSLFAFRSARHSTPIVELSLFKNPVFTWANIAMVLLSVAFAAQLIGIVLFLQESWHWSALITGLAVAPGPCMVSIFALIGQRLAKRIPVGIIAASGALLIALGSVLILVTINATPDYVGAILPGWLLIGIGIGLAFPGIIASATADLPRHQTATGSAVVSMSRQIGTVLGTSILVAILGTATGSGLFNAFIHAWWFAAALSLVCAVPALGITPGRRAQATTSAVDQA
jgi:EmrB/QacA subfamily drug resistance transporter